MAQSEDILEDLMTVAEAARELRVSEPEVRSLLADGSLAGRQLGGRWITSVEAVDDLAAELDAEADDDSDTDESDD